MNNYKKRHVIRQAYSRISTIMIAEKGQDIYAASPPSIGARWSGLFSFLRWSVETRGGSRLGPARKTLRSRIDKGTV